ncbi:hypothetical protein [Pseudomonas lundensis]|uniref:hypothetical protein n=1 Tax=Pseudomonas lundensis TaxID=86185 RepID=UPI000AD767CB|nr:hypothetical protein [Pseudomonas lundensis]
MPPPLAMGNVRLSCGLTETIKPQYLQVKKIAMRGFPLPFKGLPRGTDGVLPFPRRIWRAIKDGD